MIEACTKREEKVDQLTEELTGNRVELCKYREHILQLI
jgi:hypothetical protein